MRLRLAAGAALLALAAAAMPAAAAPTLLLIADPEGDANFSGLHGGALPIPSQQNMDLVAVTFDTSRAGGAPSALKIDLQTATAPNTTPTSSYGIIATHSVCGRLRLQIYYGESGPLTYGDLEECGTAGTSGTAWPIEFAPKIDGNTLRLEIPLKLLPREFKAGTTLAEISAYTSTAEFVYAGYQPTDFASDAGIDTVVTDATWKVA